MGSLKGFGGRVRVCRGRLVAGGGPVATAPTRHRRSPPPCEPPAETPGPNTGRPSFSVGVDFATAYVFRGIFQEDKGAVVWPAVDMGLTLAEGEGAVKKVAVNLGLWNSLHTGPSGSDGPSDKVWYESDFYASLTFGLGGGVSVVPFYTAYTSPNGTFGTVTEFAVKVSVADAEALGRFALSPYALVAFELDGGADGGERSGRYLELGIAPGLPLADGKASLAFPVKLGLSLVDYYEGPSEEDTFGYLDTGVTASVPLGFVPPGYGSWTLRGGVSLLTLGENPKALNRGDGTKVVGQFGVGLAY